MLDASAVLALVQNEPGAQVVAAAPAVTAVISVVNWAEVRSKVAEANADADELAASLRAERRTDSSETPFSIEPMTEGGLPHRRPDAAGDAGSAGLSLADRACLPLARRFALPVLKWAVLESNQQPWA